jgi:hypothetical protein
MLTGEGIGTVKEITTGIYTGVPLMHKLAHPVCKEFLGLLPKSLYHSLLQIVV